MKNTILALAAFFCCSSSLHSQIDPRTTINDYLDAYIGTNAKPYLQPAADLLTANINTGVWDWSSIPNKLYIRIKADGMLSIPKESMQTFTARTSGDFTPPTSVIAPTLIGDRESIILQGDNNTVYLFPGGYDVDRIALGTPQITVGGLFNTELSARFLTFPLGDQKGNVDFYGFGGRYSVTGSFDQPPFDLSIGYFYHHGKAGDYVRSDQHLFSVMLGKSGKYLSAHFSAGYQASRFHLHYTYEDADVLYNANLDMENSNPFILEGGLGFKLGPVFINGAVSYAQFYTFAAGAGISF